MEIWIAGRRQRCIRVWKLEEQPPPHGRRKLYLDRQLPTIENGVSPLSQDQDRRARLRLERESEEVGKMDWAVLTFFGGSHGDGLREEGTARHGSGLAMGIWDD